ncbi:MAG: site-specific integrase, partial [Acidobacteria bacterium]|nr:site-specific integrase [Acidobacteriota bacterium]
MAKQRDLDLFHDYFQSHVHTDHVDDWTKPVTAGFLRWLETSTVRHYGNLRKRKATSINRVFASVRHLAGFIHNRRGFLAGNPCAGMKELVTDEPSWRGLSDVRVMRLKSAAEKLLKLKTRANQTPVRDKAAFLILLCTGLRVSELVALDRAQYRGRHLHDVKRKGKLRTAKIFLPKEAKEALDDYLAKQAENRDGPLFCTRAGPRLTRQDVDWLLRTLAAQANATLPEKEWLRFSAHTLRHTFLRKLAEKEGVQFAMTASGHASSQYSWRYVKPSDEQTEAALEGL